MIERLHTSFGVRGSALIWVNSFIRNLTQMVVFNGQHSALDCGVPQGTVLGPIRFLLYTVVVTAIAERHTLRPHSYADDTQLYANFKPASNNEWSARIALCVKEVEKWMMSNRLKLNSDKIQFIWLGTRQQLAKVQC